MTSEVPVITLDGPSGSGKGTLSMKLADHLGWHYLDSGALYRAIGWAVLHHHIELEDEVRLKDLLATIEINLERSKEDGSLTVWCNGRDVSADIRVVKVSSIASKCATIPLVRHALLRLQQDCRTPPGLVADGRDMGTVVFPDALVKFFLDATIEKRAQRRFNQLKSQGIDASLREVQEKLSHRDSRDRNRDIAPAQPAPDVIMIDTTELSIDEVFAKLVECLQGFV